MSSEDAEAAVRALAEQLGAPLPPQHLAEAAAAWELMAPHLQRVRAAELGPEVEPAALFRP
jgi:hypothetical protein